MVEVNTTQEAHTEPRSMCFSSQLVGIAVRELKSTGQKESKTTRGDKNHIRDEFWREDKRQEMSECSGQAKRTLRGLGIYCAA